MAAPTKASSSLIVAATAVAASTTTTSAILDMRTYFEAGITAMVTVGTALSSGPTLTCSVSKDGLSWYQYAQVVGPTTASMTNYWTFSLPDWALFAQLSVKNNDASTSLTAGADAHYITMIA